MRLFYKQNIRGSSPLAPTITSCSSMVERRLDKADTMDRYHPRGPNAPVAKWISACLRNRAMQVQVLSGAPYMRLSVNWKDQLTSNQLKYRFKSYQARHGRVMQCRHLYFKSKVYESSNLSSPTNYKRVA